MAWAPHRAGGCPRRDPSRPRVVGRLDRRARECAHGARHARLLPVPAHRQARRCACGPRVVALAARRCAGGRSRDPGPLFHFGGPSVRAGCGTERGERPCAIGDAERNDGRGRQTSNTGRGKASRGVLKLHIAALTRPRPWTRFHATEAISPAVSRQAPGLLVCWLLLDSSISVFLRLDGPSSISRIFLAGAIGLLLFVLIRRPATPLAVDQIELALGLLLALSLVARVAVPYRPESPAPTVPVAALSVVAFGALAVWGLTWFARWQSAASGDAEPEISRLIGVMAVALVVGAGLLARFVIVAWDLKPGMDVYPIQDA